MKKRELEKKLKELGWYFLRSGGRHDIWTNGKETEPVGRHPELPEYTCMKILKKAAKYPGPP